MTDNKLPTIARQLVASPKGIFAADQPSPHLAARLQALDVTANENTYRDWCELLFTTPNLSDHVSGVILTGEAADLTFSNGQPLLEAVIERGIIPGISPSTGLIPLAGAPGEVIGGGLDGLRERFADYARRGIGFSKWRAPLRISADTPSQYAIDANAYILGQFAALSQEAGIVPVIEPEVELVGDHTIERCFEVTEQVLHRTFETIYQHRVQPEGTLLKASMVVSGADCPTQADVETVAALTVQVLKRTVPSALGGVVFLSGGQTDLNATAHLNAMNTGDALPWRLTFSYARALQRASLDAWRDQAANVPQAQAALAHRAKMNSLASIGQWSPALEN